MTIKFSGPANKTISSVIIACLVMAQVMGLSPGARAEAADDLKQIQYKYYFRGKYVQAIEALRTFLARTDIGEAETITAREFLAASYILSGAPDLGREQYVKIFAINELYAGPDPAVFKAEVIEVYDSARDEVAAARLRNAPEGDPVKAAAAVPETKSSKPIYKKWWFYVGLAAALVVVGAATSKEEEPEKIPVASTGTVSVGVQVR